MANIAAVLITSSLLAVSSAYNTSLSMCGSPSSPTTNAGYECTGALFTLVNIDNLNTLKTEAGCVAGMLGISTQLTGYHCVTTKNCPGQNCKCEVRKACGSSSTASTTTKSCLYGVTQTSQCPADAPASDGGGASSATSVYSRVLIAMSVTLLGFVVAIMQ